MTLTEYEALDASLRCQSIGMCGDRSPCTAQGEAQFVCTLARGHRGAHEARGAMRLYARWESVLLLPKDFNGRLV